MKDFITGFQFLTRIPIVSQSEWSTESFGRSVKFFPIIGGIIGLLLFGFVYIVQYLGGGKVPIHAMAIGVVIIEIFLTGGLHCDGLMDTVDGVFSGRPRERMLEIMKDSRVGAFGAMAFSLLILVKYSLIMDIEPMILPYALLVMPIVGRIAVVIGITLYPYARANGLGKVFYDCSHRQTLYVAGISAIVLLVPLGKVAMMSGVLGIAMSFVFCQYVSKKLGGLTGDVYGAIIELTEIVALLVFIP
ncbi:adenosylcobinamide-GDP ribazoletransferase [Pelosinus sp. sgz500959]|uniref:adenosylcobinamide-GDP ribazoletransferase n=1 Tax=Pelosinus sp. sgz500959 TaxID=3242472 RepID=UPI003671B1D4